MNFELFKLLKKTEEDLKKEFDTDSLKITLGTNEDEIIDVDVNHCEAKEKYAGLEERILTKILSVLKENGFEYRQGFFDHNNPLRISNAASGQTITNETTKDCFSLHRIKK